MAKKSVRLLSNEQRELLSSIPKDISEDEIQYHYTLQPDELAVIGQLRGDHNRLGFAMQLCALHFPGCTLNQLPSIPEPVIAYVAEQIGVQSASFHAYGQRSATVYEHLAQIRQIWGYRTYGWSEMVMLARSLVYDASENDQPLALVETALHLMRQKRIIIPAIGTGERLVWGILRIVERRTYRQLTRHLKLTHHQKLDNLLIPDETLNGQSRLHWLRRTPTQTSRKSLKQRLLRIHYLRDLALPDVSPTAASYHFRKLARRGKQYTPYTLQRFDDRKRYALLVAHLHHHQQIVIDETIDMFDQMLQRFTRRSKSKQDKHIQSNAHILHRDLHYLVDAVEAMLKADDEGTDPLKAVYAVIDKRILQQTVDSVRQHARPADLDAIDLLEGQYIPHRKTLLDVYQTLEFQSVLDASPPMEALDYVLFLRQHNKRVIAVEQRVKGEYHFAPLKHITRRRWCQQVYQDDGKLNPNYYELAAFDKLRARLRSGDIAVTDSLRYRDFDGYLLSPTVWKYLKDHQQTRLALDGDADTYLAHMDQQIKQKLASFADQLDSSDVVTVNDDGQLHLVAMGSGVPDEVEQTAYRLQRALPHVQLTHLLAEVNAWTGFLGAFTHLNSSRHALGERRQRLMAAIVALGTNMGFEQMALAGPYSHQELAAIADWYLREETLAQGLWQLDNFTLRQPMSRHWGDGTRSSSDGMRFPVTGDTAYAFANPKFFGYRRGINVLTHVADIWTPFSTQIISANDREALYVIDALCHHETNLDIQEHFTDHYGYTYHVFALCAFLGFRFAPEIQSLTAQHLFTGSSTSIPGVLSSLWKGTIDTDLIREHWDELQRLAASIRHGEVSATLIMRKLASYPRQNQLAKALNEIGKLERTRFVLEYLQSNPLRRRVRVALNKGETLHSLARYIFFGQLGEMHERDFIRQYRRISCLMLLISAVAAWNTVYLQHSVTTLRQQGLDIPDEHLQHISPLKARHINLLGEYRFHDSDGYSLNQLRPLRIP